MLNTIGALIPAQVVGVISMYIAPIIYQKEPEQPGYAKAIINQVIRYLGLAFLLALVMLFLFHDRIMLLLTSAQYVSSSWLLPYAFLGAVFLGIGQLWTLELFAYHQTKKLLVANIAPSLITLLLSYLLIPQWNIIGAVISLSFAGFVYMGLVFIAKTRFAMRRNNNFL
jgi:O-antigen/teichoic acid export membrane protein